MARYTGPTTKIARKFGEPIYGADKDFEKRNYPPGMHGLASKRKKSKEYGNQLKEKQKVKYMYGVLERQFHNTYDKASRMAGQKGENLLFLLESRLDNVVFRMHFACSRPQASQLVSHGPCLAFVNPHQRSVKHKLLIHRQVEGNVETLDECIATVRIATEIRLADTGHNMIDTVLTGIHRSHAEKKQVPSRHKGIGHAALGLFLVHLYACISQGVASQLGYKADVHLLPFHTSHLRYTLGSLHLLHMLLTIHESQGTHLLEILFRPKQTRGGILSATEDHERFFLVHLSHNSSFCTAKVATLFQFCMLLPYKMFPFPYNI